MSLPSAYRGSATTPNCSTYAYRASTFSTNTSVLDDTQMTDLATVIRSNPGRVPLFFQMYDAEHKRDVLLVSRGNEVDINASLISYLESCPALTYTLN